MSAVAFRTCSVRASGVLLARDTRERPDLRLQVRAAAGRLPGIYQRKSQDSGVFPSSVPSCLPGADPSLTEEGNPARWAAARFLRLLGLGCADNPAPGTAPEKGGLNPASPAPRKQRIRGSLLRILRTGILGFFAAFQNRCERGD